jgi:hypothetical protein
LAAPVEVGIIDTAAVEILVHGVERRLVAGVGVDRGHETMLDADRVVQHLDDRRQAVGRARGVGDDHVVPGELVVVDAVDDREVGMVGRRGDQHALGARVDMGRRRLLGGEEARALERDVDAQRLVRQLGGIALGGDLHLAAPDVDRIAVDLDLAVEAAVHRIEAEQVGIGLDRAEIVEADDLDVGAAGLGDGAQDVAADAAEPVDGDPDGHCLTSKYRSSSPAKRATR